MKISLKKWDPDRMMKRDGRIIMIIGRRGSGKSSLIEWLMHELHTRYDFALGMAPTRSSIEMLERHMPFSMVHDDGFAEDAFKKLIGIANSLANKGKLKNGLLVMDDCNSSKEAFRGKDMRNAFFNGRQYGLTIVWGVHWCMDLLPDLRAQVDYVIVLKDSNRKNKERLYNNFFGMFDKFDDFQRVMDSCTANKECLVLDNTVPEQNPANCLYWYKAKLNPPPFHIGKEVFFRLSDYYMNFVPPVEDDLLKITIPRPGQVPQFHAQHFPQRVHNPRIECVEKRDDYENDEQQQGDDEVRQCG
jgi:hypothetical protein